MMCQYLTNQTRHGREKARCIDTCESIGLCSDVLIVPIDQKTKEENRECFVSYVSKHD